MRFLITGGSGYLAGRIARYLSGAGHLVRLASRQSQLDTEPGVGHCTINWDSPLSIDECCSGIEVVVHAAALNAGECAKNPERAFTINAGYTARLLDSAVRNGVQQFQYFSTAHVYKSPLAGGITEGDATTNCHPYASSHRAAETLVQHFHGKNGLNSLIFRLSNAFGAPACQAADCWALVFNDLCREAVTQRTITLKTTGMQRRDFITVTDTARAVEFGATANQSGIFNLGGKWAPTILEIATLIQGRCSALFGYKPPINKPESAQSEPASELDYSVAAIAAQGFELKSERIQELDALLKFCNEKFNNISN